MKLNERFNVEGISLESSLNFISDGLMIVNAELEVLMFNDAARTICGVVAEGHYTQWPSFVGVYEDDRETLFNPENLPLVRAIRGEIVTNRHLHLKNNLLNEWRIVSCNASPLKSEEKIVGAILTFRDITNDIKAQADLKKERSFYHKILNSIPGYVFSKDLEGNYTFINEKMKQDCALSWSTPLHDELVVETKKLLEFEEEFSNSRTGQKTLLQTTRIPLIDNDENVYGICGISYDITDERERRKILEEEKSKIATASKLAALGMLAAEIGHEINNPLAIIRTSSWIMRKILEGENIRKDMALQKLDEIDSTIQRISEIVTSVKNLSRDSSTESMKPYRLKDILLDVQSICGPKFQAKGIQFKFDQSNPLLNEDIECYRVQLSEVLINLVVNAVDAVENSENPWVNMEVSREKENINFRVTDSGPGVPDELDKKIFSPFFSTKEIGKGTGLGLSISKEIMKKHGGDLNLNRKISNNCFEAKLPVWRKA